MEKAKRYYFVPLCLCAVALISLTGCSKPQASETTPAEKLTPVEIMDISSSEYTSQLNLMSALQPANQVTVVAKANGTLTKLLINLGDRVRSGQIIAQIDDELYQSLYKQAESQLNFATASFGRVNSLYAKQLASAQELEAARTQKAGAEAGFTVARLNLENTLIKTPITGAISAKLVELNNQVGMGLPIATIVDLSNLKLTVGVSESEISQLAVNSRAHIEIEALDGQTFSGRIKAIGVQSSPLDNMYPVEISVESAGSRLKPGMTAKIAIDKQYYPRAILIPQSVVIEKDDGKYVMVVVEGKAVLRKVELGEAFEQTVQVLRGLSVGEKLIVNGQQNVVDGEEVNIVNNPS